MKVVCLRMVEQVYTIVVVVTEGFYAINVDFFIVEMRDDVLLSVFLLLFITVKPKLTNIVIGT